MKKEPVVSRGIGGSFLEGKMISFFLSILAWMMVSFPARGQDPDAARLEAERLYHCMYEGGSIRSSGHTDDCFDSVIRSRIETGLLDRNRTERERLSARTSPADLIHGIAAEDYDALLILYNATNGPDWTNKTNWFSAAPVDDWFGITVAGGRVTEIQLNNNHLTGHLPGDIGYLSELTVLNLESNQIQGNIPSEIGRLVRLDSLVLRDNGLTGEIPREMGSLASLRWLFLSDNELTGAIPPEIGQLDQLQGLILNDNRLTGEIPPEIGQLDHLIYLILHNNQLTGEIPPEIGALASLQWLLLSNNLLTGPIPPEIGQLHQVVFLQLGDNRLTGEIPHEIGALTSLAYLGLNDNELSSDVPPEIVSLRHLGILALHSNLLEGLPDLGALHGTLIELYVHNNQFTFEDLESNVNVPLAILYAPQAPFGSAFSKTITQGRPVSFSFSVGGQYNQYQWFVDGDPISGANGATFYSENITSGGLYTLRVTNPAAPLLTLASQPITLAVIPEQAPVARDDVAATDEDTPVTITILDNDFDPNGDDLSITSVTDPEHGEYMVPDHNRIRYIPRANFHGTDRFTYTVNDGHGLNAMATVTVTVRAVDDAPDGPVVIGPDSTVIIKGNPHQALRFSWTPSSDVDGSGTGFSSSVRLHYLGIPGSGIETKRRDVARGAITYRFQLSTGESFKGTMLDLDLEADTSYTLSYGLLDSLLAARDITESNRTTLYYRVLAVSGSQSSPGETARFQVLRQGIRWTIAEARLEPDGTVVTVEGVVTRARGTMTYVQDETSGLALRQAGGTYFQELRRGNVFPGIRLRLTAVLSTKHGARWIDGTDLRSFRRLGHEDIPEPVVVTLSDLVAGGATYESRLVRVENIRLQANDAVLKAGTDYPLEDADITERAVVLNLPGSGDTAADDTPMPLGLITFTGVVGRLDTGDDQTTSYRLIVVEPTDLDAETYVAVNEPDALPATFRLVGNYPNPFNPSTHIRFDLPEAAVVRVEVFDVSGRRVLVAPDRAVTPGRNQSIEVDGVGLSSGVYFYRVEARGINRTHTGYSRLVLLR